MISLRARLAALAAVFVAVIMLGAAGSVLATRRWNDALDDRRTVRLAAIDVADLRLAYSDQETGVRGFVLAGDDAFLGPYERGVAGEEASLAKLEAVRANLGPLGTRLDEVRAASQRWHALAADPAIAARRRGAPADEQLTDFGRTLFDDLREPLERLDAGVRALAVQADSEAARVQRLAFGGFAFTLVAAAGGAALLLVFARRWVTRPLAMVGTAARAIGRGEAATLPTASSSELRDLVTAVDFLRGSLSDARDRAVRAYTALEQSAVLALHVRSELADEHGSAPDGWQLASTMRAAEGLVAGDCFDIGLVNPTSLYVVMIDVTGHGALAAMRALKAKSQLRTAVKSGLAPGAAMSWLARHGHDEGDDYLTAAVVVVDLPSGRCAYANAGHPPGLLTVGSTIVELGATGPLIGPFDATWTTEHLTIEPGSSLVLYTDGLSEAAGAGGERLGEERVHERLVATSAQGARVVVDGMVALVDEFRSGPLVDDLSVTALYREVSADDVIVEPAARVEVLRR